MDTKMALLLTTFVVATVMISYIAIFALSQIHSAPNRLVKPTVEPVPTSVLPENATILSNDTLPKNSDYMPEVGNGHIATVIHSNTIYINGLYNGANITSHRARIPSPSGYSINATTPSGLTRTYSLDVGRGVFFETFTGSGVSIGLRTYAHRELTRVLVTELVLSRDDLSKDVDVILALNSGPPSEDIDFSNDYGVTRGLTREAEYPEMAPRTEFYMLTSPSLEGKITITNGRLVETYLGLTVIDVDRKMVVSEYIAAIEGFEENKLLNSHVEHWSKMWTRAAIDVEGDLNISRINYACLYYILSSLPWVPNNKSWPFIGLSPGGLAHGTDSDYNGHVFWDQDIWMFPPIALLYPDLGRVLVETRTKTLEAAKLLARNSGFDGARYPWESAFTGLETCPAKPYPEYEIHINGDVSLMVRQYWQLTRDRKLMINESGADIVWETAKFWSERATYNKSDDTYRILGVMPPDEYHYPVNDSVYTNQIARINLKFANDLKREFGLPENETWTNICNKLYLPYDKNLDYHPEFENFARTTVTKQADVVLLGYPLMVAMNDSTRANDLIFYESSTPVGPAPAMTWGMFLLGWLDLGNDTKATELFNRSILNVHHPFYVWSENSNGNGAVNFHTGMGGYLQSVLFGYGGIRVNDDYLNFNPKMIKGTTKITFTGINYRGSSLNLQYTTDKLNLTLTSVTSGSVGLEVNFEETDLWQKMAVGQSIAKNRQQFQIRSIQQDLQ